MNEFTAHSWVNISDGLGRMAVALSNAKKEESRQQIRTVCKNFGQMIAGELLKIGCAVSSDASNRLAQDCSTLSIHDLEVRSNELKAVIVNEMSSHLFFWVPQKQAAAYTQDKPFFGEAVATRFPYASIDIEEVGKCFACNRYSAAVIHCMRVLEHGLRALCLALNLPYGEKTWQRSLEAIEKRISVLDSQVKQKAAWKRKRQFYTEAVAEFKHFKDAWRNHAAHGHEHYDEKRAEKIIEHSRSFMQTLSIRLKGKKL